MSKRITIGAIPGDKPEPLTFNVESLIRSKLLVQANSGGGKSNAIRLLTEQLAPIMPCVIIDPEGEFATLREKVDLVLVGEGGELAATPQNAGQVAMKLLDLGVSAVIDLFTLNPADRREWVRRYCENIIAAPKKMWRPFALFIDEAQMFCPQDSESVSTEPLTSLMTLSRKREVCPILVTPRFAQISTDARAPINNFLIGRATLDVDYKRAGDILGMPREERRTLASLKEGQFHAYGPSFGHDGVVLTQLDKAQTRPPKTGSGMKAVPAPSAVIRAVVPELEALAQPVNPDDVATIEAARARIKVLKAEVAAASRAAKAVPAPATIVQGPKAGELREAQAAVVRMSKLVEALMKFIVNIQARDFCEAEKVDPEKMEQAIRAATDRATQIIEANLKGRSEAVRRLKADAERLLEQVKKVQSGIPKEIVVDVVVTKTPQFKVSPDLALPPRANGHAKHEGNGDLTGPESRILAALSWCRSIGKIQPERTLVAAAARYSPTSSSYTNPLGALRAAGLIEYPTSDSLCLTAAGSAVAPQVDEPPTLAEFHAGLLRILTGPEGRILGAVIAHGVEPIGREELASASGYSPTSSSFTNPLGSLRSKGFIDYPNSSAVQATDAVFPEGLS